MARGRKMHFSIYNENGERHRRSKRVIRLQLICHFKKYNMMCCDQCCKIYITIDDYMNHINDCMTNLYTCVKCQTSFTNIHILQQHIRQRCF